MIGKITSKEEKGNRAGLFKWWPLGQVGPLRNSVLDLANKGKCLSLRYKNEKLGQSTGSSTMNGQKKNMCLLLLVPIHSA